MAVMASPQVDGPIVEQTPPVAAGSVSAEKPSSNGVNGHVSPKEVASKAIPDVALKSKSEPTVEQPDALQTPASNNVQNNDAFNLNQSVAVSAAVGGDAETAAAQSDAETAAAQSDAAGSAKSEAPAAPASEAAAAEHSKLEDPKPVPADESKKSDEDVEMGDTEANPEKASTAGPAEELKAPSDTAPAEEPSPTEVAESTQDTAVTAGESSLNPPSISSLAIDATQESTAPESADTAMTDAPSQPQQPKVARERDDDLDVDEERATKRARTREPETNPNNPEEPQKKPEQAEKEPEQPEQPDESAQLKAPPVEAPPVEAASEAMDVDDAQNVAPDMPPFPEAETPDSLFHPDWQDKPISDYASREIRRVLASVKKTKAGGQFRDSVARLWPGLDEAYKLKVPRPMDISLMERTLRQTDGLKYTALREFFVDVQQLVINSVQFNGPDHDVTGHARSVVQNTYDRLKDVTVEEPPPKTSKKEPKHAATRHAEPRAAAQARAKTAAVAPTPAAAPTVAAPAPASPAVAQAPTPAPAPAPVAAPKPTPTPTPPVEKVVQAPIHAAPAPVVPVARRESTKEDDRPKRPIHPPKKDLTYEPKGAKKKKLPPELKFCDEILKDIVKPKHQMINYPFLVPVDEARDGAYGYFEQIAKPMDIQTMSAKMTAGEYANAAEFKSDFDLMLRNCFTFNPAGTEVHNVGKNLEKWFEDKWTGFDSIVSKPAANRAPPRRVSASSPSVGPKEESEEEHPPSEPEPEPDNEEAARLEKSIETIRASIGEHQEKIMTFLASDTPDTLQIDVSQSIITMLSKNILEQKKKLEDLRAKKPAPKPKAAPKPKKAAAAAAAAASSAGANASAAAPPAKKSGGGRKAGGGGSKKGGQRPLSTAVKEAIAAGINDLEGNSLDTAINIIKKDTNQEENSNGELELEIEQLSNAALHKLYDVMIKGIAGFKERVEALAPEPVQAPPTPASATAATAPGGGFGRQAKPKKHKPMGKGEQDSKLEELQKLKAKLMSQPSRSPPAEGGAGVASHQKQSGAGGGGGSGGENEQVGGGHDSEESSEED